LEFLGPLLFRFEKPRFRGLDFLGFSRPNRLINGLHGVFAEKFFLALLPLGAFAAAERKTAGEVMRKRRSVHPASLILILIFATDCLYVYLSELVSTASNSV
jgi:hypothetical protein